MNLNVGYMLLRNVHEQPDKLAIISEDKRYTYRHFNERVNRLANALLKNGVSQGNKVAALLYNGSELAEISLALSKIGALSVPVNFRLKEEEIGYIIDHSDATLVFYGPEFRETLSQLLPRLKKIDKAVRVGEYSEYEQWLCSSCHNPPPLAYCPRPHHASFPPSHWRDGGHSQNIFPARVFRSHPERKNNGFFRRSDYVFPHPGASEPEGLRPG